jgi:hypothetical protein
MTKFNKKWTSTKNATSTLCKFQCLLCNEKQPKKSRAHERGGDINSKISCSMVIKFLRWKKIWLECWDHIKWNQVCRELHWMKMMTKSDKELSLVNNYIVTFHDQLILIHAPRILVKLMPLFWDLSRGCCNPLL